ncbi:MAG: hypothetical protein ACKVX7_14035 [Planctomycetota bacterium]
MPARREKSQRTGRLARVLWFGLVVLTVCYWLLRPRDEDSQTTVNPETSSTEPSLSIGPSDANEIDSPPPLANSTRKSAVVRRPQFTIAGRILDQNGEPIFDARVYAFCPSAQCGGFAVSDGRGEFVVSALERGLYNMEVVHMNYPTSFRKGVRSGAKHFEIVMGVWQLTGVVVDAETSEPIEEFEVVFGRNVIASEFDQLTYLQCASADGTFHLNANTATGTLIVRARGYLPGIVSSLAPRADPPVSVELERAETLAVCVVDPDRRPVVGARVTLGEWGAFGSIRVSDESGCVEMAYPLTQAHGRTVFVEHDQFANATVDVPDESRSIEVQLEPGHRIDVVVIGAKSVPVAAARVTLRDRSGQILSRTTNATGECHFQSVKNEVEISTEFVGVNWRYASLAGHFVITESRTVVLELKSGDSILELELVDLPANRINNAWLEVETPNGRVQYLLETWQAPEDGPMRGMGLLAGRASLTIELDPETAEQVVIRDQFQLQAGEVTRRQISPRRGTPMAVQLDRAVENLAVFETNEDVDFSFNALDRQRVFRNRALAYMQDVEAGAVTFHSLPPGRYLLVASNGTRFHTQDILHTGESDVVLELPPNFKE